VAEEAVAALAGEVLLMTSSVKFFQFWALGALHAGRCAQAATMPPVIVVLVATRAALRRRRSAPTSLRAESPHLSCVPQF
jgi:hypothetical protein